MIPLSIPNISGNEWTYVKRCLDEGFISSVGEYVNQFEQVTARTVDSQYAVATVNGTAALHISLIVAGVKNGDAVITSDLSFISPANAIRYVGAVPIFIGAEKNHFQMDTNKLKNFLAEDCETKGNELIHRKSGRKISALLPVHILGQSVDMEPILQIASEYHLTTIEDASECLGSRYKNKPLGSLGSIGCFSFNGNKIISTGGGGMIVTNNSEWAKRARYLTTQARDNELEYIHQEIGYNYRLSNVHAAIGLAQMEKLTHFIEKKRRIATLYQENLSSIQSIRFVNESPETSSNYWMSTIFVEPSENNCRKLRSYLRSHNVESRTLWMPLHLNLPHSQCEVVGALDSKDIYEHALCLPSSTQMSEEEQLYVIKNIRDFFEN